MAQEMFRLILDVRASERIESTAAREDLSIYLNVGTSERNEFKKNARDLGTILYTR